MKKNLLKFFGLLVLLFSFTSGAFAQYTYHGKLFYHYNENQPIQNCTVNAVDLDGINYGTTITNKHGEFSFDFADNRNYALQFMADAPAFSPGLGDALLLKQFLNNTKEFSSLQLLAADVNQDGEVDEDDYRLLMIHWIDGMELPTNGYVFDMSFTLPSDDVKSSAGLDPDNPFFWCGNSQIGDCVGWIEPLDDDDKNFSLHQLTYNGTLELALGDYFDFNITVKENLIGLGIEFVLPQGIIVNQISSAGNSVLYTVDNNILRLALANDESNLNEEINISVQGKCIGSLENGQFELQHANTEGYDGDIRKTSGMAIEIPELSFKAGKSISVDVYPNPISSNSQVEIISQEIGTAHIYVYNTLGQAIYNQNNVALKIGLNKLDLPLAIMESGLYTIKVICENDQKQVQKMLKVMK